MVKIKSYAPSNIHHNGSLGVISCSCQCDGHIVPLVVAETSLGGHQGGTPKVHPHQRVIQAHREGRGLAGGRGKGKETDNVPAFSLVTTLNYLVM